MLKREKIIKTLIVANILLCVYLIYEEFQTQGYCLLGSTCNEVWNSGYSSVLGIPLAWFGLISFAILFILHEFKSKEMWIKRIYLLSAGAGAIIAIYLIAVQALILNEFCITCMFIDSFAIVIAILASEDLNSKNSE